MKNIGTKWLILSAVIIGVGCVIAVFYTMVWQPPTGVNEHKPHQECIDQNTNRIQNDSAYTFNDPIFDTTFNKIEVFNQEGYINATLADNDKKRLMEIYVHAFVQDTKRAFLVTGWGTGLKKRLESRIKMMKKVKSSDGRFILSSTEAQQLESVSKVLMQYDSAQSICNTGFTSIQNAQSTISSAKKWLKHEQIGRSSLSSKLQGVPKKMESAHYNQIKSQVNKLEDYRNFNSMSDFENYSQTVLDNMKSYEDAEGIYEGKQSLASLREKSKIAYSIAQEYFERLAKEVTINTNGWERYYGLAFLNNGIYTNSYGNFQAYRSYSNYGKNNQNSLMSFTFKGYEEFVCYIASSAENRYDYVLISKVNDYSWNFKLEQSYSDTKDESYNTTHEPFFSDFRKVIYSGLDKNQTYQVWVNYYKDDSRSYYEDRGYLLLPQP